MHRRQFCLTGAASALTGLASVPALGISETAAAFKPQIRAVAFDGFPIFDPRPILTRADATFPDRPGFGKAWFDKIFAYTWLRTVGDRYLDMFAIADQALDYTAATQNVTLGTGQRKKLMSAWLQLEVWPDVPETLETLKASGLRLAFLSNLTEEMLRTNARNNGIEGMFEYFSTDRVRNFKPDPLAYQMGVDMFGLPKEEIVFCAFAAWDAAGARWFDYPTVWVNRLGLAPERLDAGKITQGKGMDTLVAFIQASAYR